MSFSLIISVIALVISIINVYRFNKGGKTMTAQKNNRRQELPPNHIMGRDDLVFIVYDDCPPENDPKMHCFARGTKCPKGFTGSDKDDSETKMCCILALCAIISLLLGGVMLKYILHHDTIWWPLIALASLKCFCFGFLCIEGIFE